MWLPRRGVCSASIARIIRAHASLIISAIEHPIFQPGRFKLGVGTVLTDQELGSPPDVKIGHHRGALASDDRNRFGERLAYPLAFLPNGAISRGLGWRPSEPIGDGQPRQRQQVVDPVQNFEAETTEHRDTISRCMQLHPTDDEKRALAELLRSTIANARYPLSPRLAPLRAILARLEPREPRPVLPPPLRAYDAPSARRRRR